MDPGLRLSRTLQAKPADPKDENIRGDTINPEAGRLLHPYRADKAAYLDFMDEKSRICRFAIDEFSGNLNPGGLGAEDEVLKVLEAFYEK